MPKPWSWEKSNGSATAAQTKKAYTALMEKGSTHDFSHWVWNDLVENTNALLAQNGQSWSDAFAGYDDTLIPEDGVLTARRFNSLRFNILNSGWPWAYNPERPDYLGREDVQPMDLVYGSYLLELAHKYDVMLGMLDGTVGTPMQHTGQTRLAVTPSLYAAVMRGTMLSLLLNTNISDAAAIHVIEFLPTLLRADRYTAAQCTLVTDVSKVLFETPVLDGRPNVDTASALAIQIVPIPKGKLSATDKLIASGICELDSESSDNLEIIRRDDLSVLGGNAAMCRFLCKALRRLAWRSSVTTACEFAPGKVVSKLSRLSAQYSNINTACTFGSDGFAYVVLLRKGPMRSDIATSALFEGWWATVEKLAFQKQRSWICSDAEFVISYCTEILSKGYKLQSGITSDTSVKAAYVASHFIGNGSYSSAVNADAVFFMDHLVPYPMEGIRAFSDVYSAFQAMPSTASPRSVRPQPYTIQIASCSAAAMSAEAQIKIDPMRSNIRSASKFAMRGEMMLAMEGTAALTSGSDFDGIALRAESSALTRTERLAVTSQIHIVIAPAWIYPVQTENELYIAQARTIEQIGTRLVVG